MALMNSPSHKAHHTREGARKKDLSEDSFPE